MVSARLASEPDRLLGGKERSYAWLSSVLSYSHDLCEMLGLPNTEVGSGRRQTSGWEKLRVAQDQPHGAAGVWLKRRGRA